MFAENRATTDELSLASAEKGKRVFIQINYTFYHSSKSNIKEREKMIPNKL